jgi:hypothetical protein
MRVISKISSVFFLLLTLWQIFGFALVFEIETHRIEASLANLRQEKDGSQCVVLF